MCFHNNVNTPNQKIKIVTTYLKFDDINCFYNMYFTQLCIAWFTAILMKSSWKVQLGNYDE